MGAPYQGVLYAGLMITAEGPKLIEYNVRFGDPECQVIMLRLMSDLVPALLACCDGVLGNFDLRWYPDAALTVVMAAKGYPGSYAKGSVIEGLDAAATVEGVEIFHAGTQLSGGNVVANGGRVLNVCATGASVAIAQARATRRSIEFVGLTAFSARYRLASDRAKAAALTMMTTMRTYLGTDCPYLRPL
jgi:phosphoribosylamine--glycine ligase